MEQAMRWLKAAAEQQDGAFIELEKRGVRLEMRRDDFLVVKTITWDKLLAAYADPIGPLVERMREELREALSDAKP